MKSKIFKTIIFGIVWAILFGVCGGLCNLSFAATNTTYVSLSDGKITVNNQEITTDSSKGIYLSSSMNNGGTSSEAKAANIEVTNVINITEAGIYEFSGTISDGQISVNSNVINGEVVIILNNANITCKNAPAIFVYNKTTNSDTCKVTIKTASGTTNAVTGGKIKQSVEDWSDQSELQYYVEKDYDDEHNYYERYKYDGAISSDISLTFEGEGTLNVNSSKKEGIESKRSITINSGNIVINSLDDGINACTDNESVITINGGTVLVKITEDAEEGDGIDSNGSIYINGGNVYAFACSTSGDNGLDADNGIYINGGNVVATGNMADTVSSDSKQTYLQLQFSSKVEAGTLITITDSNDKALAAFKSDRSYSILTISTPNLQKDNIKVYEGGTIDGTEENGLYTSINSYTKGTIKQYSTVSERGGMAGTPGNVDMNRNANQTTTQNSNNTVVFVVLGVMVVALIVLGIVIVILKKKGEWN